MFRDRRLTLGRRHRAHPAAGQLPARRAASAATSSGRRSPVTRAARTTSAIYLHNGNEYLEAMLGVVQGAGRPVQRELPLRRRGAALPAGRRAAPRPSSCTASSHRPWPRCCRHSPTCEVILQVPDESGNELLPGAVWYEDALAAASPDSPAVDWSPDDLYILYTGGTTGMPKGVLWRNGDAIVECFGGSKTATLDRRCRRRGDSGIAGAARAAVHARRRPLGARSARGLGGGTVFVQSVPERLDPADMWCAGRARAAQLPADRRRRVRPPAARRARPQRRTTCQSLTVLLSGGAPLSRRI